MTHNLPTHIAIIPDGNRRWAAMRGIPTLQGHQAGAGRMRQVVEQLIPLGVKYLTVWGFSSDNWKRTADEVQSLLQLLQLWIEKDTPWLHEKGVRLNHIGRLQELPGPLRDTIVTAMHITKANSGMTLNLAFNYSGRAEIVAAVRHLIADGILINRIDEQLIGRYLYTNGMPDVDLVIRTANEFRLSNFMLWQTAYSEFYFSDRLWPDFNKEELEKALNTYATRQRRFGGG